MKYSLNQLINKYFNKVKIASLQQLKTKLNANVDKTVQRYLKELGCFACYSHKGKYYTHDRIAKFDKNGLWEYKEKHFSKYGTLIDTIEHFIEKSDSGYNSQELHSLLKIGVNDALLKLVRDSRIVREKIEKRYFYFSADTPKKKQQLLLRRSITEKSFGNKLKMNKPECIELKRGLALFINQLDEKQKRLFAGLESARLGYGGDKIISKNYGLDPHTVSKGRGEILSGDFEKRRIRKIGGGRIQIKKKALIYSVSSDR